MLAAPSNTYSYFKSNLYLMTWLFLRWPYGITCLHCCIFRVWYTSAGLQLLSSETPTEVSYECKYLQSSFQTGQTRSGAQRRTATVTSLNTLTVNMSFKRGKLWHCLGTSCLLLFSSFWPTTSRTSQTSLLLPLRSLSDWRNVFNLNISTLNANVMIF